MKLYRIIIKKINDYNSVLEECTVLNTKRLLYLTIIAIPLRLIVLSTIKISKDTPVLEMWSKGIVAYHIILLILLIMFFAITFSLKDREVPNMLMNIIQYFAAVILIASGIGIVTVDQLITTNITPFVLVSIVTGLVFLIRPLISFAIFSTSYIVYYHAIATTITSPELLMSNRVNGITAVGIGFLLSVILWNYNYTIIAQRRRIDTQQEQLQLMAYYDSLTDLPNRRLLDKLVNKEVFAIKKYGYESTIMILDIDDFKNINDTYGHPVGDHILKQLAVILKNNVREPNIVARLGGEEFIILMPKTSLEKGYNFAERLRETIANERFTVGKSISATITASFGVSLIPDTCISKVEEYYTLADKALLTAKNLGKNKVIVNEKDTLDLNKVALEEK